MAHYLAIDWSRHEVRYVLANRRGKALEVEAAAAIPLTDVGTVHEQDAEIIGTALQAALVAYKLGKPKTLVGVNRASVELHHFTLPPATDAELPVLVANQALRESSTITDESVLDFTAATTTEDQPREVTAALLAPLQLESIQQTCARADLKPNRILLRPYASAALYLLSPDARTETTLLINLVDDEADLTIVAAGSMTFSRTVRIPLAGEQNERYQKLFAEIPRTLMVAPQQKGAADSVHSIRIFGKGTDHQPLLDLIAEKLNLSAESFDPFEAVGDTNNSPALNSGQFASLLGMISVEAEGGAHAIDFLHPRQPPVTQSYRRPLLMAAGLATLLLGAFSYTVWEEFSDFDSQISRLGTELKDLKKQNKHAKGKQEIVETLSQWQAGDVVWLDELRDFSLKLPGSRDVTVLQMSMGPSRSGGGTVKMQVLARGPTVVKRLEQSIRDEYHKVGTPRVQQRNPKDDYAWHFETSVAVAKRDKQQYLPPPADADEATEQTGEAGDPEKASTQQTKTQNK